MTYYMNGNSDNTNKQLAMTLNIPIQSGMILLKEDEYKKLVSEHLDLTSKFLQLAGNEKILQEIIKTRDKTIVELKRENAELKRKIEELEKKYNKLENSNNQLKNKIVKIEKDNVELKKENIELKKENIELKKEVHYLKFDMNELKEGNKNLKLNNTFIMDKLNKSDNKRIFSNFVIAIQDFIRIEELHNKVDNITKTNLQKLNNTRINTCHYIDDNDNADLVCLKILILTEQIDNMSMEIKEMFNKKYPNMLNNIKKYMCNYKIISSQETIDEINEWWE